MVPLPARKQDLTCIDEQSLADLDAIGARLDPARLWWASGYLAGLAAREDETATAGVQLQSAEVAAGWTILYGTETGNARQLAETLQETAAAAGLQTRLSDIRDFKPSLLKKEHNLLLVIATHGLGEPPDGTEEFFEYLTGPRAPRLEQLNYSVLALGDKSYDDFCAMGRLADERLAELGATRVHQRVDCDLDFDRSAQGWMAAVVSRAKDTAFDADQAVASVPRLRAVAAQPHTRRYPFLAEVLVNQKITGRDSGRDVRHIELSLEGSGMRYQPGDAIGVRPQNPPRLVAAFIRWLGVDADTPVRLDEHELPLQEALRERLEITRLSRGFMEDYAAATADRELVTLLDDPDKTALRHYLDTRQPIDMLQQFHHPVPAAALTGMLRELTPRLYSIASSPDANPDEAHLTVAVVCYQAFGTLHWGSASSFLADASTQVPVHVQPNAHFRLPADHDAGVIMIGAGTGVAPFRAFVEHRQVHGARGGNWLIFGARNFSSDFLYQLEWQRHLKAGSLDRIDLAFSRDQADKIYVQQRIREQGRDLYDWLEKGAFLYVCGDALRMAPDVHRALLDVIATQAGVGREDAEDYLRSLKRSGRYRRDVY